MDTLFFGYMHMHYNSVEGGVHYFFAPTYKGVLSKMLEHLVKDTLIVPTDYDITFSNAVDFITDGDGCGVLVDGNGDADSLKTLLDDLTHDNLSDDAWFEYKAPEGGVVDPKTSLVMSISYNVTFGESGYDTGYQTFVGSMTQLEKDFRRWTEDYFKEEIGGTIKEIVSFLNKDNPEDEERMISGLNMRYSIQRVGGKRVEGDTIL